MVGGTKILKLLIQWRDWSAVAGKSRAALHAKALVFDRKSVFIGSFNLDPRSTALNTEIGVMIDGPEIAGQVGELMDEGVSPGSAFHVALDKNDDLMWTAENGEAKVEYDKDPQTSFWQRFVVSVVAILTIEQAGETELLLHQQQDRLIE